MSDIQAGDFEAGDLVECISVRPNRPDGRHHFLALGNLYRVERLTGPDWRGVSGAILIELPSIDYARWRFRKIQPYQERFAEQLRAVKPINHEVPA